MQVYNTKIYCDFCSVEIPDFSCINNIDIQFDCRQNEFTDYNDIELCDRCFMEFKNDIDIKIHDLVEFKRQRFLK